MQRNDIDETKKTALDIYNNHLLEDDELHELDIIAILTGCDYLMSKYEAMLIELIIKDEIEHLIYS